MKKTITLASIALATLLGATACGNSAETGAEQETVTPVEVQAVETQTPEPVPSEDLSERGNMVMETGDTAQINNWDGVEVMTFTVNSIEPIEQCVALGAFAEEPENGALYAVDISVVTTPEFEEGDAMLSAYQFEYVSPEGTRFNGDLGTIATYGCVDDSATIPSDIGPGEKMTGLVVLDLPADEGTLVFNPDFTNGFEYTY